MSTSTGSRTPESTTGSAAIELRGIGKRFPGVIANHDIEITIERGTIHALVGENGAGKSTLMKILYGVQKPDDGTIAVEGEQVSFSTPADAIAREELSKAGLDGEIWQCPVVLLADVRSVGVQGDGRTYGHPIVLRPVSSEDAMTADWTRLPYDVLAKISNRITNEVREVNRVVLDVTSKPPGTIEWE